MLSKGVDVNRAVGAQGVEQAPKPPAYRLGGADPFEQAQRPVLAALHGVMTDIDDTLTKDGAIEPAALAALQALHRAGVPVLAITGRPLGWSLPFAQAWPVRAIVAENGAVAVLPDTTDTARAPLIEYAQDESTRAANTLRLQQVAQQVLQQVSGACLAQDSPGRVTDIAIDHSEFTQLPPAAIEQVVQIMRGQGMNATVSSIHINGWFGTHTKYSAAQWMLQRLFGRRLEDEIDRWVYVGDSTNDQLMFSHFPLSVGVANLMRFEQQLQVWPRYITRAERGQGFAEVAQALLAARALASQQEPGP